jgi:hypothetical protein
MRHPGRSNGRRVTSHQSEGRSNGGHSRALSVDVADLPVTPSPTNFAFSHSPFLINVPSVNSFAEEDSNAGSPTLEEPNNGVLYPSTTPSVDVPSAVSESSSGSEHDEFEPVQMRRDPGR